MPQSIPLRKGKGPEFDAWSEWILLANDLAYCNQRIKLWSEAIAEGRDDISISMFRDLVVTFTSCFDTSVQVSLDPTETFADIDGGPEYFRVLDGLRNSYVAHRHGPARQCTVGGAIDDEGNLLGPGHLSHLYVGPPGDEAGNLSLMVRTALAAAKLKVEAAEAVALAKLEAMPPHARKKLPVARTTAPSPNDHAAGRKKFRNRTHPRR